ncbi:MAG: sigma-54-dependent Fis family transcriptional regulator [Sandaracinus sp.]|nr:sigma-54-dependent Fis family transcriptional regulator [Sandaracinus sp.]
MGERESKGRRPKLLVVDDGDRYVELFHALLRDYDYATRCELPGPCWECPHREGCTLTHAHDWAEVEQALSRHPDLDAVLLDVRFDLPESRLLPVDGDARALQGLAILAKLRARRAALPVVLMTGEKTLGLEHAAPLAADEHVTLAGDDAYDARALGLLVERLLSRRMWSEHDDGFVWGTSMARLRRDAEVLARTSLPMLVLGETGTGKSALAERVVHRASRRSGRFVAVDLGALPSTLAAAELFGSARGAFSGAVDRPGRFEEADGGTLFLDEIGNLPLDAQGLLLLALQDGRVTRLGENRARSVDVKLVAATNADLGARVREGEFRPDLYARLNPASRLTLPPLRERPEDVLPLARAMVARRFATDGSDRALLTAYTKVAGLRGAPQARLAVDADEASPSALTFVIGAHSLAQLRAHAWPGNARELELLVGNLTLLALSDALAAAERGRRPPLPHVVPLPARLVRELLAGGWSATLPSTAANEESAPSELPPQAQLRDVSRELERALYARLFDETRGDFEAMAARLLVGDPSTNARRVRTRFNQLGLSARERRR